MKVNLYSFIYFYYPDRNIIPIGCVTGKFYLSLLKYHAIKLLFEFKQFEENKNINYTVSYEIYQVVDDDIIKYQYDKKPDSLPSALNFLPSFVQFTGTEDFIGNRGKVRLNFNSVVTHLLFSLSKNNSSVIEPCNIKMKSVKFLFNYEHDNNQNFSWESNDQSALGKIGNYYLIPFVKSFDLADIKMDGVHFVSSDCNVLEIILDGDSQINNESYELNIFAISTNQVRIASGMLGKLIG